MSEKNVRFGILGASRIAQKSVIPAMHASAHAELVMVGSRETKDLDLPCAMGSYDDVLNSDVEAVYISLPNTLHEEWAIKALKAGKHVWCEKPAALTYASAKRMVAASGIASKRLMEGFMFLRHPQHAKVRELIDQGEVGGVTGFVGIFQFPMPADGNIRLDTELGGGAYYDAAVYPIRASRMIFGEEPVRVKGQFTTDAVLGVDTRAMIELTFPSGRTALAMAAFDPEYKSTYTVVGTSRDVILERAYAVPPDMEVHISLRVYDALHTIAIPPADHFQLMIDEFCTEIRADEKTKNYEEDLLAQARVTEAGKLSALENRIVELSEIV